MNLALLMDIDGTLTPTRHLLEKEMADALGTLNVPFYVAAGSDLALIEEQFLKPLWNFGFRKDFEAFLNNGASHYRCALSKSFNIELLYEFSFKDHLGKDNYKYLRSVLSEILDDEKFKLPSTIRVIGKQIKDRISMVNFVPIGRPEEGIISEDIHANRRKFEKFDKETNYRLRIVDVLKKRLSNIIEEKKIMIMLGGKTSFDICIKGKDKTNAARKLFEYGYEKVVFLGDAFLNHGNDSVIITYIDEWSGERPCPLISIPVDGWEDTMQKISIPVEKWKDTIQKFQDNAWIS